MISDIETLYSWLVNLNIAKEETHKPFTIWRFDVLHIRGVEELSSNDVYDYFNRTPHMIEWLSNISCNVTFKSVDDALDALSHVVKGIVINQNDSVDEESLDFEAITSDKLLIPVPPKYRYVLGKEHPKAKSLIVRFATVNDKKCDSFKEDRKDDDADTSMDTDGKDYVETTRSISTIKTTEHSIHRKNRIGKFSMRMRADEEEKNIANRRRINQFQRRSVTIKPESFVNKANNQRSIWRRPSVVTPKMNVKDLREKLIAKSMIRVQVTYDD